MCRSLIVLATLLFVLGACSDGGGSGADCALNPTLPGCQPGGDALVGDADGLVAGDATESCTGNARRCTGQKTQQCIDGAWRDLFACPVNQQCEDGFCVGGSGCSCDGKVCGDDGCGNSCGTCSVGSTCEAGQCVVTSACNCGPAVCGFDNCGNSCGTCAAGATCNGGQCSGGVTCSCGGAQCGYDNCGNPCGACPSGWACSGGTCVENGSSGDGSCGDIIDCIFDTCAAVPDEQAGACQEACYAAGSLDGRAAFNAYVDCAGQCGDDGFCFADYCSADQAACFFAGAGGGTCFGIIDCMDYCFGDDDSCIFACYEAATRAAQTALLALNNCLGAACPDAADDECFYTAIDGACADHMTQCLIN